MFKVSVPASLVWFGEHSILHQKKAIGIAINNRMTVVLRPRQDQIVTITSLLGHYQQTIAKLAVVKPFNFVLAAICLFKAQYAFAFSNGFDIEIEAAFSEKIGFGSSAAVTAAVIALLYLYIKNEKADNAKICEQGRTVIQSIQKIGSGLDIATSVYGGVIAYQMYPSFEIEPLGIEAQWPGWIAYYCGFKTPTPLVIDKVLQLQKAKPELFSKTIDQMGDCTEAAINAIKAQDWPLLGTLMNVNQDLLNTLGVSLPILEQLIAELRAFPTILGAKISGAGLGDCVLGFGKVAVEAINNASPKNHTDNNTSLLIPVTLDKEGLRYEPI